VKDTVIKVPVRKGNFDLGAKIFATGHEDDGEWEEWPWCRYDHLSVLLKFRPIPDAKEFNNLLEIANRVIQMSPEQSPRILHLNVSKGFKYLQVSYHLTGPIEAQVVFDTSKQDAGKVEVDIGSMGKKLRAGQLWTIKMEEDKSSYLDFYFDTKKLSRGQVIPFELKLIVRRTGPGS